MEKKFLNQAEKLGRAHYQILLMSWAGWVFDFYDLMLLSFLIVPIGKALDLSKFDLSLVIGTSLAATALGGVLFGYLCDRYGRKSVLQLTIIIYSIGTFLVGFSFNLTSLLIFRIITGLGVGGEWATGQTFIGETFPAKLRGRFGAFMQTGAPIGIALAAVVGGFLEPMIGWRYCFYISIIPALLVIFIRKKLPESDVWEEKRNLEASGLIEKRLNKIKLLLSKNYRSLFFKALALSVFDMSAYWFTYSWLPGYLNLERNLTLTKSTIWMLVTQLGGFLGYASFGIVSDKLGRRPAYTIYSLLMASGLLMITIFWEVIAVYNSAILIFMFLVGFGTGMFGGFGPLFSELFPTQIRSTAMGSAFNLARGVQFLTPIIITFVAASYGLGGGISIAAFFAILTGLFIWVFPETRGKTIS
jgi:MFS family permease